jgi:hypothetical protein
VRPLWPDDAGVGVLAIEFLVNHALGDNHSRRDAIDTDPSRSPFERQAFSQRHHTCPRSDCVRQSGTVAIVPGDSHVRDDPALLLDDAGKVLAAKERSGEIGRNNGIPPTWGNVLCLCRKLATGIIDRCVYLAETIRSGVEHGLNLIRIADITGD